MIRNAGLIPTLLLWTACSAPMTHETTRPQAPRDLHSYAKPNEVRVGHVALDLTVSFANRSIEGVASLAFERVDPSADSLTLDTRELDIRSVESAANGGVFAETAFHLGEEDPTLGQALTIELPPDAAQVRIRYATNPGASGLQWLEAAQTAGKARPFLFTQSQAIHARSWIPLQDSRMSGFPLKRAALRRL